MKKRLALIIILLGSVLFIPPLFALERHEDAQTQDHEQLRSLLGVVRDAVNSKNFEALKPHFSAIFSATMIDQSLLTSQNDMEAYLAKWFEGDNAFITSLTIKPEADAPTQIYDEKFGVAHGTNIEVYGLTNGKSFTLNSRWTATVMKESGQWKILAIHSGVNFLDNPIFNTVKETSMYFGVGGILLGLLIGFVAPWFIRRFRHGQS